MKLNSILLVDDDKICNYLHEKVIRRLDITKEIHIASNGLEALEVVNAHINEHRDPPQLILLDLKMPVMDGFEFLKKLQDNYLPEISKTIVAVLSTSGHPKDMEKISGYKNVVFFSKPLTDEKLKYIHTRYFLTKKGMHLNHTEKAL